MSIIDILLHIAAAVLGYVIGSVNAAVIITKYILKSDVRERGSKNAGAANVTRVFGPVAGGCTLLLDMAKVMFVMWLGGVMAGETGTATAAIACLTGHCFPIFFGFKGGKAVAICLGVMGVCNWPVMLLALGIFLVFVLITKIVSVGSIFAALSLIILTPFFDMSMTAIFMPVDNNGSTLWVTLLSAVMAAIVILKHTDNIKRLIKGTEKPLTVKENKNV